MGNFRLAGNRGLGRRAAGITTAVVLAGGAGLGVAVATAGSALADTAPAFTVDTPPTAAVVGPAYSYTFTATGDPAPTYSLADSPSWLSISVTTGAVTGTPPSGTASFSYEVFAANTAGKTEAGTGPFSVKVTQAPSFTRGAPPLRTTAGALYSYKFAARGIPAPTFSLAGAPRWLSVNSRTGAVSGRVPSGGRFSYSVIARNSAGSIKTRTFVVTAAKLRQVIHFRYPPVGAVGRSAVLTATGGGSRNPVTFSVDRTSGRGVCRVAGRTVRFLGNGTCVVDAVQAGNTRYDAAEVKGRILVGMAPRFVRASAPRKAVAGKPYAYRFAASGYPAARYALTGAPRWLSVNSRTGAVSGIVPRGTKSFTYTVEAVNTVGRATVRFTVAV
jgi:hypothetical protein